MSAKDMARRVFESFVNSEEYQIGKRKCDGICQFERFFNSKVV